MKLLEKIKKWRNKESSRLQDNATVEVRRGRVQDRRDFRINRLEQRTKLASARKWMWIALAIIAIVVGVLAFKFGLTGGLI